MVCGPPPSPQAAPPLHPSLTPPPLAQYLLAGHDGMAFWMMRRIVASTDTATP